MSENRLAFVDTNVLVYAFDRAEDERRGIASKLLNLLFAENRFCVSTQVLQEFYVNITRKISKPLKPKTALDVMNDFIHWRVFLIDYPAIQDAAEVSQKNSISFWDALIIVSAKRVGASILYTEDLSHGTTIHGVRVENPFRA